VVSVTTAYIGASADLVRGFITTPLERVIASADGIDYIESSSAQGVSTITVHLKLNYDTNAALTQIQAKVAQVRNDLPPEAEAPVIDLQTADTQFAAMYLGFSSKDLDQNQITDYLTRVVQPKLSSVSGVQRADILGGRTFAMRIWLKPERMAAANIAPSQVWNALAQNNYLSALGRTKGTMTSVNLVANTNLQTPEEFRALVVKQDGGTVVRLGDIADVQLGAENYEQDVRFDGQAATFMGIWVLPTANALEVIGRVRKAMTEVQASSPSACTRHSLRLDALHPGCDPRGAQDPHRDAAHRGAHHLPVPGLGARADHPGGRDTHLADRRGVPDADRRLHDQPADAARDRAVGRARRRRRDRHGGERRTPPGQRGTTVPGRDPRGSRAGRSDHRHDDHAGGGVHPDRDPGRPHRLVVPGVRVHARGRGDRVRRRRAHAVTDDGLQAAARGRHGARLRGLDQPPVRARARRVHAGALRNAAISAGGVHAVGGGAVADRPFYMFSQHELAPQEDQGVIFGIVQAAPNNTLDQTMLFTTAVNDVYRSMPETQNIFQITSPPAASAAR